MNLIYDDNSVVINKYFNSDYEFKSYLKNNKVKEAELYIDPGEGKDVIRFEIYLNANGEYCFKF